MSNARNSKCMSTGQAGAIAGFGGSAAVSALIITFAPEFAKTTPGAILLILTVAGGTGLGYATGSCCTLFGSRNRQITDDRQAALVSSEAVSSATISNRV